LQKLLQSADHGLIYRQGVRVAIVGRPNVGKSSLLNALLRGNRAIVTNIPGTTRDTLEETVNVGGLPLVLVDTAGIRGQVTDEVERIGVDRSRAALARADVALMVIDGSSTLEASDREIAALVGQKPALVLVNKHDLPAKLTPEELANILPDAPHLTISALTTAGIDHLEEALADLILGGRISVADTPLVSNPRHKALLQQALAHTQAAIEAQQAGLSPDLVSIDVRASTEALGEITGETVTEDLLETIFSNFCIGK
jgi:tRNA modification GTPase